MVSPTPQIDDLLPVGEAVQVLADGGLSVAAKTLRRWADLGAVPSVRTPGGQRRFRRSDVEAILSPETETAS